MDMKVIGEITLQKNRGESEQIFNIFDYVELSKRRKSRQIHRKLMRETSNIRYKWQCQNVSFLDR